MQSLHSLDLVRYVCVQYFSPPVQSQECVLNLPMFADQGGGNVQRLQSGTQTIIPDYSFDCYGNVTHWGAYVERHGGDVTYTLDFQVWRRSGGGQGPTGNYDFVGSNLFSSIDPPGGGEIDRSVPVEDQIKVRPGDVIGLYITTSADNGVELKQQDNGNEDAPVIWFATSLRAALSTRAGVGSTSGYELTSTTTAVVLPSTPSQTPSPSSPGTSQTTQTLQTQAPVQLSATSTPQPSSLLSSPITTSPPVGSGLPVEAIAAVVIVVLIMIVVGVLILVFILTLVLRRRSKKRVLMVKSFNNPEYSGKFKIMH